MDLRKILKYCLTAGVLFCAAYSYAHNDHKEWHEAQAISGNFKAVTAQPDIEVFSAPNVVMVKLNRPTEVRLFTILGKLISSQRLEPGIFEYKLDSHGIYIIKTEDTSCKVAI